MPWRTEYYICPIDNEKYNHYMRAVADLEVERKTIQNSISNLKAKPNLIATSSNTGDCCDIFNNKSAEFSKLLISIINRSNMDINSLSVCINRAQNYANMYEKSRNKSRDVWYDETGGGFTYGH